MRLPAGRFFGTTHRTVEFEGVRLATIDYRPSWEQPWHTHERVTFFVHVVGDQIDEGTHREWTLPPLGLIFHSDSTVHRSRLGPSGARGINLELTDDWLERHEITRRELGEHRVATTSDVRTAALALLRSYAPTPWVGTDLAEAALELVACFTPTRGALVSDTPTWLKRVEGRIEADFRLPIGLSGLAREVGVHPTHLARVFRHRHRRSVTEQIQRRRLQAAVDQILAGRSVGEAALEAGFADQFHFSRLLQAQFGYRPKWIKRLRTDLTSIR